MDTIRNFRGEYRFLSNFYPCRITYNGYQYTNVEAAFQSEKSADLRDCSQFTSLSARVAKQVGRSVKLREDWEQSKVDVMSDLLRVKFLSNPELLAKLLQTGDAQLSEGNNWHDNFWGDCGCERCAGKPGKNTLGRLLMELRGSIHSGQSPDNISKVFRYMGIEVEPLQLFSKARVLAFMHYNGASCETLDLIRDQYNHLFGVNLVWRYPIFDTVTDGGVMIPVREGFLWLPYDENGKELTEYYRTKNAHLLNQEAVQVLLRDLNAYADGLRSALTDMLPALGGVLQCDDEAFLTLTLPEGQTLRAVVSHDAEYPAVKIELEGPSAHMHPEPLCYVEHNPNRPEGHQLCICAYTADDDDPDYYKSYVPCKDNQDGQEKIK